MKKNIILKNIKLIIWDLDDTLWNGIFAEGEVTPKYEIFELIKKLNYRGIVSSICSKNDEEPVKLFLEKIGYLSEFVFVSINYENKASRVLSIINKMNLREENCLFVDDNPHNLGQALFLMPKLMCGTPEIVEELKTSINEIGKEDNNLSRLNQYRVLERKTYDLDSSFSEEEFLKNSSIYISIFKKFNSDAIKRIVELNNRAHQLNYTKKEMNVETFKNLMNSDIDCGLVHCKDKYGDYGFVGFYALSKKKHELIYYFFSCRVLGMHIEQYIYQLLNYPIIKVVGDVTVQLKERSDIRYIKVNNKATRCNLNAKRNDDILIVGPCDLEAIDYYLPWNADVEFRYFDEQKRLIGYGSHPLVLNNVLNGVVYSETPFFNAVVNGTSIFSKKYKLVIYSYITALLYGEYKNKSTGESIVFGEWSHDITKTPYSSDMSVCFSVSESEIPRFKLNYEYQGRADSSTQSARIIKIVDRILSNGAKVCLILGSEIKYENEKQVSLLGSEIYARDINTSLKNYYKNNDNVFFINPSDFILSQSDYNGSIQHYSRRVYKQIADSIYEKYSNFKKIKTKKKKPGLLYSQTRRKIVSFIKRFLKI